MKQFILSTIVFSSTALFVQNQQVLSHINTNDVKGVYKVGNKAITISFSEYREYDDKNVFVVNILGDPKAGRQELAVSEGTYLLDVASNAKTSVAIFSNTSEETIELVAFDENAKISSRNSYKGDVNDLESYSGIEKWVYSDKNILYLIRRYSLYEKLNPKTTKLVNQGYQLLSLDAQAKVLGVYSEDGINKPFSEVKTMVPNDEGCVLFVSQNESKKKTFGARLEVFNTAAALTGTYALSGVDFTYYPTDIIYKNGEIVAAGMYFKGLWHNAKTSEGLFFLKINSKGEKLASNNLAWADIKAKLTKSDKSDFMFNGKTDFLVEAIEVTPDGFIILGESYAKSSGVSTAEFLLDTEDNSDSRMLTIYDFISIETDKSGIITSVKTLSKEKSNIRIYGGVAMMRNVELSFLLKKYNKFPFQDYKNGEIHYISYKNNEGFYSIMDAKTGVVKSSTPVKLTPEIEEEVDVDAQAMIDKSGTLTKLDKFSKKMDNFDKKLDNAGNKLDYAMTKTDAEFYPGQVEKSGIIMMENGSSVYYILHPETSSIYYLIY